MFVGGDVYTVRALLSTLLPVTRQQRACTATPAGLTIGTTTATSTHLDRKTNSRPMTRQAVRRPVWTSG